VAAVEGAEAGEVTVVKEGYLEKLGRGPLRRWQTRYFKLLRVGAAGAHGHRIVYFHKKERQSLPADVKGTMELGELDVAKTNATAKKITLVWKGTTRGGKGDVKTGQKLQLQAPSNEVAKAWVRQIQEACMKSAETEAIVPAVEAGAGGGASFGVGNGGGGGGGSKSSSGNNSSYRALSDVCLLSPLSGSAAHETKQEWEESVAKLQKQGGRGHAPSMDKRVSALMRAKRKDQLTRGNTGPKKIARARGNVFSESMRNLDMDMVASGKLERQKTEKHMKTKAERARIKAALELNFLFKPMSDAAKWECIDAMEHVVVTKGETIITEGEDAMYAYVIDSGSYDVIIGIEKQHTISEGVFGELALLYNCPRSATVEVGAAGKLWQLDRQTFRHCAASRGHSETELAKAVLRTTPLLSELGEEKIVKLAEAVEEVHFSAGDQVITIGVTGSTFYIIKEGAVECRDKNGACFTLNSGEFFGERSILTDEPRAADVYALTAVTCLALDRDAFNECLGSLKGILESNVNEKCLELVPLFMDLMNYRERAELAMACVTRQYAGGETIISEGEDGDFLFVLKSGRVAVSTRVQPDSMEGAGVDAGEDVVVSELATGEFFGEMALFAADHKRVATVKALELCDCLVVERQQFKDIASHSDDDLLMAMIELEADRRGEGLEERAAKHAEGMKEAAEAKALAVKMRGEEEATRLGEEEAKRVAEEEARAYEEEVRKELEAAKEAEERAVKVAEEKAKKEAEETAKWAMLEIGLDDITVLRTLGQGTFGKVKLVQHKETKKAYALKVLQKALAVQHKQQANVMAEKEAMVQAQVCRAC
jgi:CRP-like cAMP-binding protein